MKYYELIASFDQYNKEKSALLFLTTEILGVSKSEIYQNFNQEVDEKLLEKLNEAIRDYVEKNIPVQYIIGYTYFYGCKIKVNKDVLIPRFDTEEIVDHVINYAKRFNNPRIVDVGTGSGCIAIAIKKKLPNANITAIDISHVAINIARENAINNGVSINFIVNDLLMGINDQFDIIVSNPPYIDPDESIMDLVYDNEPHLALFSSEKGLYHYRLILEQSRKILSSNGRIIFEIAYNNKQPMLELARQYYKSLTIIKDIHNNDRIMIIG